MSSRSAGAPREAALDVLLPIHEQGHALSKIREAVKDHVAVALPS
jgi:hypothetical protein